jgi:von Willebrand factor type A domain
MMYSWRVGATALLALLASCGGDNPVDPDIEVEDQGIVLDLRSLEVRSPANVTVLLKAETSEGDPLAGLTINSFQILEDGEPISQFEAPRAFVPKPGKFVSRTFLVLDLSGSVVATTLSDLRNAARVFVNSTLPSGPPFGDSEVGIWWFDGAAELHSLAGLSDERDPLLMAIDAIDPAMSEDISTNLHGAVIEAVRLAAAAAAEDARQGIISSNAVVIFTDGTDRAARRSEAEALSSVSANEETVAVYTIGLEGEIRAESLEAIGVDGFFSAASVDELVGAFEGVGQRIRDEANSFYFFDYCSPKRAGNHRLTIGAAEGNRSGSITTTFSASGFAGGCQAGASASVLAN